MNHAQARARWALLFGNFVIGTGVLAPAGTPRENVARLSAEVVAILKLNDVAESLAKQGAEPEGMTPEQFAAYQKSEIEKWARVVKEAGITVN